MGAIKTSKYRTISLFHLFKYIEFYMKIERLIYMGRMSILYIDKANPSKITFFS